MDAPLVEPKRTLQTTGPLAHLSSMEWIDIIPEAVSIIDADGNFVYLNEAWARLTGASRAQDVLEAATLTASPSEAPKRADGSPAPSEDLAIARALRGEVVTESEVILTREDGRPLWLQTNARPIRDENGTVIGAVASSHDVTHLRMLEREHGRQKHLSQQRAQELETIISSMVDAVIISDAEGRTLMTNRAYEAMIGREPPGLPDEERWQRFEVCDWSGQTLDISQGATARALRGEEFSNAEYLLKSRNGPDLYVRVSGGPLSDESRGVVGAAVLIRDVTHIRQAEKEKDEFLSLVAHELRTPITLIRGFTQLLRQSLEGRGDALTDRRLAIIDRRSEQLSRLITGLLDMTRLDMGTFRIDTEPFDYLQLLKSVVDDMNSLRLDRRIQMRTPRHLAVQGDPLRLQQVLINLIDNALTHGPAGQDVVVTVTVESGEAITSVADQGEALPASERDRIFERFYQVRTADSQYHRGIGLGLYISRRIVEAHGGRIWVVDSDQSCFAFSLPLSSKDVDEPSEGE